MSKSKDVKEFNVWTKGWHGESRYKVFTEKEAWECIGKGSVGQLYEVTDEHGEYKDEFIPF